MCDTFAVTTPLGTQIFLGTATEGTLTCRATMPHGGRTTQVWDATVTHEESGKTIALFRCTQMVLWPRA